VNLGQLRSIQVFVVGRALKPGSFTIGSLSTLLNALLPPVARCPGSLRDIQVRRGGATVTHFDLYDLCCMATSPKTCGWSRAMSSLSPMSGRRSRSPAA